MPVLLDLVLITEVWRLFKEWKENKLCYIFQQGTGGVATLSNCPLKAIKDAVKHSSEMYQQLGDCKSRSHVRPEKITQFWTEISSGAVILSLLLWRIASSHTWQLPRRGTIRDIGTEEYPGVTHVGNDLDNYWELDIFNSAELLVTTPLCLSWEMSALSSQRICRDWTELNQMKRDETRREQGLSDERSLSFIN